MALTFETKPVATIKATDSVTGTATRTINGVTTASTTPQNAATQINKLLGVAGKGVIANENMTRVITEEAVDNV